MRRWWFPFLFCWLCTAGSLRAEEYTDPIEAGDAIFNVSNPPNGIRVTARARQSTLVRKGRFSERVDVYSPRDGLTVSIETPIPPARVIDDLGGFLAVRSNRLGGALAFRAVLPHQLDPRTGQPLVFLIRGASYRREDEWQELVCSANERALAQSLALVRQMINRPQIDTRDMYIDRLVYRTELRGGVNSFWFDDLQISGLIRIREQDPVTPINHESATPGERPSARMALDQLLVDERPFFPRILPDHGETPGLLSASGFNTIWVSNSSDAARILDLKGEGLSLMATPPRAQSESGELIDPQRAVLAPFTPETAPIAFWYLGSHIPSASRDELAGWKQQVASADRRFDRPIMADIAGNERTYSRGLSMTACSRPVLNTSWSYRDYHLWLKTKRQMCFPGSFFWTWIDIDAGVRDGSLLSPSGDAEHVIEPEQLRLQVYSALAAGCRGLGFWSRIPLNADRPGRDEIRLMLAQLNREIELLTPILATGTLSERTVTFEIDRQDRTTVAINATRVSSDARHRPTNMLLPPGLQVAPPTADENADRLEATVIMSGTTVLLLPLWHQENAQYVPGSMSTREATVVVPGVPESASAWLITTHGLQNLDLQFANGGRRIRIPDFRMTSAIIVTSDRDQIRRLQTASRQMARDSTAGEVELARAKLERVRAIERQLNDLGVMRPDSELIVSRSESYVADAELSFRKGNYEAAFRDTGHALQLLRALQRARWEDACRAHSHPGASPFLYCYQTLPKHWQLMRMVGARAEDQLIAMLASGSFEQVQTLLEDGWQHSQFPVDGVKAAAELYPAVPPGMPGEYCLRLAVAPETNTNPPPVFEAPPVRYSTPRIPVQAGDVLLVTGWMRVKFPATNRLDRALIKDNFTGENGSLRFGRTRDWQRFELLRVAEQSGEYQLNFVMEGLGEMQIDDVRIASLRTIAPPLLPQSPVTPDSPTFRERFNDLFNRIPGVNRLPGFGELPSRTAPPQP